MSAALAGLVLGFLGSIPIAGPIAVLVVARALDARYRSAIFVAIGAGIAEGVYAFGAFYGLASIGESRTMDLISRGAATLILLVLGILLFRKGECATAAPRNERHGVAALSGFLMAALNPTLLATWAAGVSIVLSTGLVAARHANALPFAIGATAGIVGWFALFVLLIERGVTLLQRKTVGIVIKVTGAFVIALSAVFAFLFFHTLFT